MNAKEKFEIPEGADVTAIKSAAAVLIHDTFFKARRKVMRGLEEHLELKCHGEIDDHHNFIFGTYVYRVTTVEGDKFYIKFEADWVTFGSSCLYSA